VRLAKIAELDERHRDVDGFCLMKMPWYHGAIASDTAAALLDGAPAGTFLMRTSIKRAEHAWALSVVQTKANSTQLEVAHVRVHNSNGRAVRVDGYPSTFPTARYMVSHIGVLVHAMPRRTDAAVRAQTPLRVTKPPIGKGATGVVFKARIELPELDGGGVTVALKQLRSELEGDADEQASMAREVDTMLLIPPHPNIVALLGIVMQAPVGIVTEFLAVGSLDALLYKQKRRFALPDQRRLASEIACGVAFLHENNIVHRDLATRNILLSEDLTAKVSDFGMSRMLGDAKYNYSQIDSGPIRWMAPEQLKRKQGVNKSVYSPATDAFSFAMTLVELATNQLPWPQLTNVEAAIAVCQAERPELDASLVEPTVLRVIETCWAHEPTDRLTLSKAHSVLTGRSDIGDEEQDNDDDGDPMPLSAAPEALDDDDAEPYDAPPPHLSGRTESRPALTGTPPRPALAPLPAVSRGNRALPQPTRGAAQQQPRRPVDADAAAPPPPPPAEESPPPSPPPQHSRQ
jgi:serine/threonine protein kinase